MIFEKASSLKSHVVIYSTDIADQRTYISDQDAFTPVLRNFNPNDRYLREIDARISTGNFEGAITLCYSSLEGFFKAFLKRNAPDYAGTGEIVEASRAIRKHLRSKLTSYPDEALAMVGHIADLAGVDDGLKPKAKRAKYDHVNGGNRAWLSKVDGQPLDVLTPETVVTWRNAYVARAGTNPVKRKSAERSAASYLRCARSLFTKDVLGALKVKVPGNPFAGVKLKDRDRSVTAQRSTPNGCSRARKTS